MRVLVVGGTSSLASALKPTLSECAEVVTAGRKGCDVHLDLGDPPGRIELPTGIDVVVNAAAHFGGKTFDDMLQAEAVNVLGVLNLCQACTDARVQHLILISSIFASLDPGSPFFGAYALSKRHSDEMAQLYSATFGLPLTILRPSQIYGVGEAYRKHQPFLFTIIDRATEDEDILIHGSNDARRNFIHVEDVVKVITLVIQRKLRGVYECVNIENVTYSQVAAAAIEALQSKSIIKNVAGRPDIPDNAFALDDTLFRLIDYFPRISIREGMKKEAAHRGRAHRGRDG